VRDILSVCRLLARNFVCPSKEACTTAAASVSTWMGGGGGEGDERSGRFPAEGEAALSHKTSRF
jgi:hypothetical protein